MKKKEKRKTPAYMHACTHSLPLCFLLSFYLTPNSSFLFFVCLESFFFFFSLVKQYSPPPTHTPKIYVVECLTCSLYFLDLFIFLYSFPFLKTRCCGSSCKGISLVYLFFFYIYIFFLKGLHNFEQEISI